ncbi:transglutaminase domain-containing protein [Candidatus Uabimicrobium sp. HlEnr_7]|uniref:transglutaminase domain-containing protein n=1 Tax=Candidatus Uabimicrobium helgolandensis TaxID=3095367 RepID=UPI0035567655
MLYSFFLLLSLLCLGEFAVFNFINMVTRESPIWLLYVLPSSFFVGVIFSRDSKGFLEKLRRYVQLETLFIIGMIFYVYMLYTTKNHPLINFGYFMVYSMALSAGFIFREFSTYLYLLSCSLLFGVSQLYDGSDPVLKAGVYLGILVLSIVIHNDYMNHKYVAHNNKTKVFPFAITIVTVCCGAMIMAWMTFATPKISNYLDSIAIIREYFSPKQSNKHRKQKRTSQQITKKINEKTSPKQTAKEKIKNTRKIPENQKTKQANDELNNHTQVSMEKDLKFGDIDFSNITPQKLFEVELATETLGVANVEDLYWKLGHFDTYDAQNGYWYLRNTQQRELPANKNGWTELSAKAPRFKHNKVLQMYTLYHDSSRLYYLTQLGLVDINRGLRDRGGNIFPENQSNKYQVVSYVRTKRNTIPYDVENVDYRYITVPQNIEGYRRLARRITQNFRKPYYKVKAIERFLQTRFKYDLKPGIKGGDATFEFLFRKKRGYCQHFASAMVLLLRSIDIPARVTVGCHGGIWDAAKGAYVVSSIHRHAWVEVPFEFLGWTTFDPTPVNESNVDNEIAKKINEFKRQEKIKEDTQPERLANGKSNKNKRFSKKENLNKELGIQDLLQQKRRMQQQGIVDNGQKQDPQYEQLKKDKKQLSRDIFSNEQHTQKTDQRIDRLEKQLRKNLPRKIRQRLQKQLQKERLSKKRLAKKRESKERLAKKLLTKERLIEERLAKERLIEERLAKERLAKERLAKERLIEERLAKERLAKEKLIEERLAKERLVNKELQLKKQDKVQSENTNIAQKNTKKSNNISQNSSKEAKKDKTVNGIITFIKNMAFFCISLLFIFLFFYLVPQIINLIHFFIKILFSKNKKQMVEEAENVPKWGKMIANIFTPRNKTKTELGQIVHEYTDLSKKLQNFGLEKKNYQTPTEYLHLLQLEIGEGSQKNIQILTQLFLKAKYSPCDVNKKDVELFKKYCQLIFNDVKKAS